MQDLVKTKKSYLFIGFLLLLLVLSIVRVGGIRVPNNQALCSDVVMLFARGSSSNPNNEFTDQPFEDDFIGKEEIPGAFFHWMELRLKADYPHINYKAISIHNSNNGWSPQGYPAVGIFNLSTINNMFDAEWSWWPAGSYRGSVASGSDEMAGQVRDEINRCPNQRIVMGGYSQGAQVVHESLTKLSIAERNQIDNAVMFGDPKFIGAEYNRFNLLDKPKAYPWHRGTAGMRERGLADAQDPYVPEDMKYKTISWCHEDDFVCTGFSGLSWGLTNHELPSNTNSLWSSPSKALGDGHSRYPVFGVPEATAEVVANLDALLKPLEIARGGINPAQDPSQTTYSSTVTSNKPIDVTFLMNTASPIESAWSQFYSDAGTQTVNQITNQFTNVKWALGGYTGVIAPGDYGLSKEVTRTRGFNDLRSDFGYFARYGEYVNFGAFGGGGDYREPHGLAIEKYGSNTSWRSGSTKNIVIFTESPAQNNATYNECATRNLFNYGTSDYCQEGINTQAYSTKINPERCNTIIDVLAADTCQSTKDSGYVHIVSRTLQDAVTFARARGIAVTIVQPVAARSLYDNCPKSCVENELKTLAESTGGLYLKYGQDTLWPTYDQTAFRHTIWQVLNNNSKVQNVTQYASGSLLDFGQTAQTTIPYADSIQPVVDVPLHLTTTPVSGAQSYSWDYDGNGNVDELTQGPTVEHVFGNTTTVTVAIAAYASPQGTGMSLSTKVIVVQPVITGAPTMKYAPVVTDGPTGVAVTYVSGTQTINVVWTPTTANNSIIVVSDPVSGAIIATAPASLGATNVVVGTNFGSIVNIQLVTPAGESAQTTYKITEVLPTVSIPVVIMLPTITNIDNSPPPVIVPPATPSTTTGVVDNVGLTNDKVVTQKEPNNSGIPLPAPSAAATSNSGTLSEGVAQKTASAFVAAITVGGNGAGQVEASSIDQTTQSQTPTTQQSNIKTTLVQGAQSSPRTQAQSISTVATTKSIGRNKFKPGTIVVIVSSLVFLFLLILFMARRRDKEDKSQMTPNQAKLVGSIGATQVGRKVSREEMNERR